jgi:hypothetical protein
MVRSNNVNKLLKIFNNIDINKMLKDMWNNSPYKNEKGKKIDFNISKKDIEKSLKDTGKDFKASLEDK